MSDDQNLIRDVSDTARWAAVYRAQESERPDALFHDPYARRLAGERGEQIARSQPFHQQNSWSWIARTYAFDSFVTEHVQQGFDLIVNLAAGLDTRPYRMQLPPSLRWVEVDLPAILDYKEEVLSDAKPVCKLERIRVDLADVDARRSLFELLGSSARRALVISEGLLIYLSHDQVKELATDLAQQPAFQRWVFDIASPGLLKMLLAKSGPALSTGSAPLRFAPENGPKFFEPFGWTMVEVKSMLKTAAKLKRLPFRLKIFSLFPEDPTQMGGRPWSGACLLQKT